jgi:hypothetical protein
MQRSPHEDRHHYSLPPPFGKECVKILWESTDSVSCPHRDKMRTFQDSRKN